MEHWTVIGIFDSQDQAKQALDELRQTGFDDGQLGYVYRDDVPLSKEGVEAEGNTSSLAAGIVDGVLGAANAILTPILSPSSANAAPETAEPDAGEGRKQFDDPPDELAGDEQNERPAGKVAAPEEQMPGPEQPVGAAGDTAEAPFQAPGAGAAGEENGNATATPNKEEVTGAITGGIVGGVLGAAVALLIPVLGPVFAGGFLVAAFSAALGAVTGSFVGVFVAMGIPEEHARHYEREFASGRTIVTVNTIDRKQEVLDLMYRNGASYANAHDTL